MSHTCFHFQFYVIIVYLTELALFALLALLLLHLVCTRLIMKSVVVVVVVVADTVAYRNEFEKQSSKRNTQEMSQTLNSNGFR